MKLGTMFYSGLAILLPVIVVAAYGVAISLPNGAVWKPMPKPKMFFGQQFNETDLEGTGGTIQKLAVACDLTTRIIPDLMTDGFMPTETSKIMSVDNKVYTVTFWTRMDTRIVTESDPDNVTCIIFVSRNIKPSQSEGNPGRVNEKSRDNLYEYIPI